MHQLRLISAAALALVAPAVIAHPGHPAADANHTHGPFEIDPFGALLLALAALAAVSLVQRAVRARRGLRSRAKR